MRRTAASSTYATRALVLRTRQLGEKDRILTLFSPDKGRFGAVAKGARGAKSKLAALAQPLVLARFLLVHGKSLEIVSQAEIENAHSQIAIHVPAAAWAAYACELCDSLPENTPDPEAFELLAIALAVLDHAAGDFAAIESAGLWFEARFLAHMGYAQAIGVCVACETKIRAEKHENARKIAFSPRLGGTLCGACAHHDSGRVEASLEALRTLHRLERAETPMANLEISLAAKSQLAACLRRALSAHLDVRLRSRAFLDEITAAQRLAL